MQMLAALRVAAVLIVSALALLSLRQMTWDLEKNECAMTYMREMPQFIPIKLSDSAARRYPHYALFLYGEGYAARALRSSLSALTGTPVLFIPGNGGSFQQARSIGSVALVAGEQKGHNFNVFTIDFNEELVALHGGSLWKQTEFVAECVQHILGLYKKHSSATPSSVVLIGHSMGGLLARAVFMLPSFDVSSVRVIVTQATPHQGPVASFDCHLEDFYSSLNKYWVDQKNGSLRNVVVISSGGGSRDVQVPYHLTVLDKLVLPSNGISVSTTAVPGAWVSTDHLCAVWCLQMVVTTVQSLFPLIESDTKQLAEVGLLTSALRRRFEGKDDLQIRKVFLNHTTDSETVDSTSLVLDKYKNASSKYFIMTIQPGADTFYASATKRLKNSWIFGCRLRSKQVNCTVGDDLSALARPLPPAPLVNLRPEYLQKDFLEALLLPDKTRKAVLFDARRLSAYSHLLLLVPGTSPKSSLSVHAEQFSSPSRTVAYHVPALRELVLDVPRSFFVHVDEVIAETDVGALFYNVSLVGLTSMYQAYTARLKVLRCVKDRNSSDVSRSVMGLHLPWSPGADTFAASRSASDEVVLMLKLQAPVQADRTLEQRSAELHLHLQPECVYSLHVGIAFAQAAALFFRHYSLLVPAFVVASLVVARQRASHQTTSTVGNTLVSCLSAVSWIHGLGVIIIPSAMLAAAINLFPSPLVGMRAETDVQILNENGFSFMLLPLCLHTVSYVAVVLHLTLLGVILKLVSGVLSVSARCCSFCCPFALSCALRYGLILCSAYISVQHSTAAGLAVLHALVFAQTAMDMRKQSTSHIRPGKDVTGLAAHGVLASAVIQLVLDQWLLALTAPSLLHWIKYLKFSWQLVGDPWKYQAVIRIACAAMLNIAKDTGAHKYGGRSDSPRGRLSSPSLVTGVVTAVGFLLSIMAVDYCSLHLHRLSWIIALAAVLPVLELGSFAHEPSEAMPSPVVGKPKKD